MPTPFPALVGFSNLARVSNNDLLTVESGSACRIYDKEGRDYIDGCASFYTVSLGYDQPQIVRAAVAQMERIPFYATGYHRAPSTTRQLADAIRNLIGRPDSQVAYGTSGSEAVEFAIKLIRYVNAHRGEAERSVILSRKGSYHGSTIFASTLGGSQQLHDRFLTGRENPPLLTQPDFRANAEIGETEEQFVDRLIAEAHGVLTDLGGTVAALIAEPVSFSAGLAVPPASYFPRLQALLAEFGVPLITDEVVTAMGRFGAPLASAQFGIEPDWLILGKALSSGYGPISAAIIPPVYIEEIERGSVVDLLLPHATTFGGHPVSAAIALEVIRTLIEKDIFAHVEKTIPILHDNLRALTELSWVAHVETAGLAGAIHLEPGALGGWKGEQSIGTGLVQMLESHGVLLRAVSNRIIVCPPLIIGADEIRELKTRFVSGLTQFAKMYGD